MIEGTGFGRMGIALLAASGGMKALNRFALAEINEWVIMATAVVAFFLIMYKVLCTREDWKIKRLERRAKEKELLKEKK